MFCCFIFSVPMTKHGATKYLQMCLNMKLAHEKLKNDNDELKRQNSTLDSMLNRVKSEREQIQLELQQQIDVLTAERDRYKNEFQSLKDSIQQVDVPLVHETLVDISMVQENNNPTSTDHNIGEEVVKHEAVHEVATQIIVGAPDLEAKKGNVCDNCEKWIAGPPSQLKKHKSDHCKPAEKIHHCPICDVRFNYNGLRHHLCYYNQQERIFKATNDYRNHGLYTTEDHKQLRESLVEAKASWKKAPNNTTEQEFIKQKLEKNFTEICAMRCNGEKD